MKNTILLLIIFASTSCTITQKLFHKNKSQIDSTSQVVERKDSIVNIDSSSFKKEENQAWWKYDTATKKDNSVFIEDIVHEKFDTSGKLTEKITTHRKKENNKQTETSSTQLFNNHSKIDSNELKKEANLKSQKEASTHVTKKEKEVTEEVHKKRTWLWWLLLLIPVYFIVRHRKTIWLFIRHKLTGL